MRATRTGESSVSSNKYRASSSVWNPNMYVFARMGTRSAKAVTSCWEVGDGDEGGWFGCDDGWNGGNVDGWFDCDDDGEFSGNVDG